MVVFYGLCLGSFATALAWRLPFGRSIFFGDNQDFFARSACPSCKKTLSARDLIPVLSWLLNGGRCRYCKVSLSVYYPVVELATAGICLLLYAHFGFTTQAFVSFALAPLIVSLIDIDFRHKIIPDEINLAIGALGILFCFVSEGEFVPSLMTTVLGPVLYGGTSWLLRFSFMKMMGREALGLGDVKFFAASGLWLGSGLEVFTVFLLLSGIFGIVLALVWRRLSGEREFPFGPALAVAFLATLLYGNAIVEPLL